MISSAREKFLYGSGSKMKPRAQRNIVSGLTESADSTLSLRVNKKHGKYTSVINTHDHYTFIRHLPVKFVGQLVELLYFEFVAFTSTG